MQILTISRRSIGFFVDKSDMNEKTLRVTALR